MAFAAITRAALVKGLAILIMGSVVGAGGATLRLGREMDRLTLDNAILMDEVERLAGELTSRERTLTERRRTPVRSVEVQVDNVTQEHIRLHMEQRAHDLLQHLVGEEVSGLNAALIEKALRRAIHVDKQDFVVKPTLIVLGSKVFVRLEANPGNIDVSD